VEKRNLYDLCHILNSTHSYSIFQRSNMSDTKELHTVVQIKVTKWGHKYYKIKNTRVFTKNEKYLQSSLESTWHMTASMLILQHCSTYCNSKDSAVHLVYRSEQTTYMLQRWPTNESPNVRKLSSTKKQANVLLRVALKRCIPFTYGSFIFCDYH